MSYFSIPTSWINIGKALKKELFDNIKNSLDDHEARINALSVGSGPVIVFNEEIENASSPLNLLGIKYYKAFANMQITKAQIQIFTKDGISSGALDFDLKKSSTLGGVYTSIFSTKPTINYSTDLDNAHSDGVFNTGQSVAQDEIIRLDLTSIPPGAVIKKFRILVYGVLS